MKYPYTTRIRRSRIPLLRILKRSKVLLWLMNVLTLRTQMEGKSRYYYEFDRNMNPEQSKELNINLKYFKKDLSEFDSPDSEGSGNNMDNNFLMKLDYARHNAGIPFKITSGYRTKEYNEDLTRRGYKTSKNSSHMKGVAVDIQCNNSESRYKIIQSLMNVGITRIGIGKNFVHCDTDNTKIQNVIWNYY